MTLRELATDLARPVLDPSIVALDVRTRILYGLGPLAWATADVIGGAGEVLEAAAYRLRDAGHACYTAATMNHERAEAQT